MIEDTNSLKQPYKKYIASQVFRTVREIPKERRAELADEIRFKAWFLGCENKDALKAALKHLEEES